MYVCMYVYIYACVCMYVCMYVCTYVCMYVRMYDCMYCNMNNAIQYFTMRMTAHVICMFANMLYLKMCGFKRRVLGKRRWNFWKTGI